jgi:predicted histidine transporter YuiF (NhaC family)
MLNRFSRADRVCALGAIVMVAASFMGWFHSDGATVRTTVNGFRAGILGDAAFIAAAVMLLGLLVRHGIIRTGLDRLIVTGTTFLVTGGIAALAVIVQLLQSSGRSAGTGLLAALVAGLVMAFGGQLQWREDTEHPALRGVRRK